MAGLTECSPCRSDSGSRVYTHGDEQSPIPRSSANRDPASRSRPNREPGGFPASSLSSRIGKRVIPSSFPRAGQIGNPSHGEWEWGISGSGLATPAQPVRQAAASPSGQLQPTRRYIGHSALV